MKRIKLLSIGNSFSQDAQRYLHGLGLAHGVSIKCVNLVIGGCSLRTHYLHMLNDERRYALEWNGEGTGFQTSIREALSSDDWDYVTVQQASHFSFDSTTYFPYIEELCDYIRLYAPRAKILIQQTWAYEKDSQRLREVAGFETPEAMLEKIVECYAAAAETVGAYGIIPSGLAMSYALEEGLPSIHRDTFHAALGVGRYLLALTWYGMLTGEVLKEDTFDAFDLPVSEEERRIALVASARALADYLPAPTL